jgi:hypothetical protein
MSRRSVTWGAAAAALLAAFYAAVLAGSAGWNHLGDTFDRDWWLVLPLTVGFGVQVALLVEARRRHRAAHDVTIVAGAGAGTSAAGMIACCAHHLADLVPLVGLSGAATFLTAQQRTLMWVAVAMTVAGVVLAARQLRRVPAVVRTSTRESTREPTCAR